MTTPLGETGWWLVSTSQWQSLLPRGGLTEPSTPWAGGAVAAGTVGEQGGALAWPAAHEGLRLTRCWNLLPQ